MTTPNPQDREKAEEFLRKMPAGRLLSSSIAEFIAAALAAEREQWMQENARLREHIKRHLNWGPLGGADRTRFMALALCGEAGELANLIKKDWRGDAGNRHQKIIDELADVANYAFMLAEVFEIDIQVEMLRKLIEVEQRPEWKSALAQPAPAKE